MPIALRSDFDAATLRRLARRTRDSAQARRLLALAVIYDGGSRAQAAETGGVTRQIVRDWVVKFNADGPEGLIDRKIPGRPSKLEEAHRDALRRIIESGPIPSRRQRQVCLRCGLATTAAMAGSGPGCRPNP